MASKKSSVLKRLKDEGKAFTYHNKNWKVYVTIILSSPDEVAEAVADITGDSSYTPYGLSGFSLTSALGSSGPRHYLMWVDNRNGFGSVGALAHEAVHIAGLVLTDCGVSVNLKDISASECLAYLVEDMVRFALPKLDWRGLDVSKLSESNERE